MSTLHRQGVLLSDQPSLLRAFRTDVVESSKNSILTRTRAVHQTRARPGARRAYSVVQPGGLLTQPLNVGWFAICPALALAASARSANFVEHSEREDPGNHNAVRTVRSTTPNIAQDREHKSTPKF